MKRTNDVQIDDNPAETKKRKDEKKQLNQSIQILTSFFIPAYQKASMPWLPDDVILCLLHGFDLEEKDKTKEKEIRLVEWLRGFASFSACSKVVRNEYDAMISNVDKMTNLCTQIYKEETDIIPIRYNLRDALIIRLPYIQRMVTINEQISKIVQHIFINGTEGQFHITNFNTIPTWIGYTKLGKAFQFGGLNNYLDRQSRLDIISATRYNYRLLILLRDIWRFYASRYFYCLSLTKKLDYRSVIVLKDQKARSNFFTANFFSKGAFIPYRIVPFYTKTDGINISRLKMYQKETKSKKEPKSKKKSKEEKSYSVSNIYRIKSIRPDNARILKVNEATEMVDIIKQNEDNIRAWQLLINRWNDIEKDL